MRCSRLAAVAAVLLSGMAVPAFAAWDRIGSVDVSFRGNNDVQYNNFGGRVEGLALRARDSDVNCRDVTAEFADGERNSIFQGVLPRGRTMTIDLPGRMARLVRQLVFDCRAVDRSGGRVEIAANVGRYMAQWQRNPQWARLGNGDWDRGGDRLGNDRYVSGQLDTSGWLTLGTTQFNGQGNRELSFGVRGPSMTTLALRPTNDDARCSSVRIRFADGERMNLNINSDRVLREDRMERFDLPGNVRSVTNIEMDCRAEHGRMLSMDVMATR